MFRLSKVERVKIWSSTNIQLVHNGTGMGKKKADNVQIHFFLLFQKLLKCFAKTIFSYFQFSFFLWNSFRTTRIRQNRVLNDFNSDWHIVLLLVLPRGLFELWLLDIVSFLFIKHARTYIIIDASEYCTEKLSAQF